VYHPSLAGLQVTQAWQASKLGTINPPMYYVTLFIWSVAASKSNPT